MIRNPPHDALRRAVNRALANGSPAFVEMVEYDDNEAFISEQREAQAQSRAAQPSYREQYQ